MNPAGAAARAASERLWYSHRGQGQCIVRTVLPFFLLFVAFVGMVFCTAGEQPTRTRHVDSAEDSADAAPISEALRSQGEAVADLSGFANEDRVDPLMPVALLQRPALLEERRRLQRAGDVAAVARLNSLLASEAFERAWPVAVRWLDRRDPSTGLFPKNLGPDGRVWTYGDAGADLFPFVALASRVLVTHRYPEMLAALSAERALSPGFPRDLALDTRAVVEQDAEEQMLGAVEYAKDGLLPLVEMLGPDPWLGRLREVIDHVLATAAVPTRRGPIPANSSEINGSVLQVLARLYWATGDPRYVEMGDRIAAAYLDDALPTTEHIPAHRWNFVENDPIGPRRFFLGDHGAEIVSGLVEWHRVELATGAPGAASHRAGLPLSLVPDRAYQLRACPR